MRQLRVRIEGKSPLLMHSERLANPLDPATKAHKQLTSKRKKTDADYEAIAKSEWMSSIYFRPDIGPYLPGQNIDAGLKASAKFQKLGTRFGQAVMTLEDEIPLQYKGPRDLEGLYAAGFTDVRGVRVGTQKVMRCRPKFNQWAAEFTVVFNEDVVNEDEVRRALSDGGALIGTCDFRPRYGKFTAEVLE